jgi:hypothetical protein
LDVEKDYGFQRRAWVAERIGWSLMALVLAAAAAGAFGRGFLSNARAGAGSLELEYERCVRLQAPTELRVRLPPRASQRAIELSVPRSYWEGISVKEVLPPADAVQLLGDEFLYRFLVEPGAGDVQILFRIEPQRMGTQSGWLAADGESVAFRQFVLP